MTEWKCVPAEPTMEMRCNSGLHHVAARAVYLAMIAAAPEPPKADEPVAWHEDRANWWLAYRAQTKARWESSCDTGDKTFAANLTVPLYVTQQPKEPT